MTNFDNHALQNFNFATRAIHVGQEADDMCGAVVPPIYLTSTYKQSAPGQHKGYDYTRGNNPCFVNLEKQVASLENAEYAIAFSSGLGAITSFVSDVEQGQTICALNNCYGGTYRLMSRVFSTLGTSVTWIEASAISKIFDVFKTAKPKYFIFETPTNPLLEIIDIQEIVKLAKEIGVKIIVDNTFATPFTQNPLTLGADAVLHSSSKYLGGHSDLIGGIVATNNKAIYDMLMFKRLSMGFNPSPFDCWLFSRSVKTLAIRMERHCKNAMQIAKFLQKSEMVDIVYYPGLSSHPNHNTAAKQMHNGYGGMISAVFKMTQEESEHFISSLKIFTLAESLGCVESLVEHPASMTHASVTKELREKLGIVAGLVRFSIGIEDVEDLIQDLEDGMAEIANLRTTRGEKRM